MSTIRQDAWSEDEDLLLAETVLRHIREGSTQLAAFEEVGKSLSRTAAACGFRWNSLVRKKFETAIAIAKKQRKELNNRKREEHRKNRQSPPRHRYDKLRETAEAPDLDLNKVIAYLESLKDVEASLRRLNEENEELRRNSLAKSTSFQEIEKAYKELKTAYEDMRSEYQAMLAIMDKARQLASDRGNEKEANDRNESGTEKKSLDDMEKAN
ncbi:RsfA family transcriptional regulator [Camelliibacillus cellulosilyticus]|uniref:RsfA family transcriptional regulator n=1 Tax=Camelliibacillus cellulosilyticus TaxID=2174486 RepID=A0ABV9GKP5_9BACL